MNVAANSMMLPDFTGTYYLDVLQHLMICLRPKRYLEVGSRTGGSLKLADCASVAIDPQFDLERDFLGRKPACHLFQMTSDACFRDMDIVALLRGPVEFAFLDGRHLAEYLLRDFLNTERLCRPNSVIAIHDCIPTDLTITRRIEDDPEVLEQSSHPDWWAGDVWKVIWYLKKFRPDLSILALDAAPTGLVLVTHLAPGDRSLEKDYFKALEIFRKLKLEDIGLQAYFGLIDLQPTSVLASAEDVTARFWL